MNKNGAALKSGIWYTISNFIVKSIGFLTTPIFTRLLTKEEFGLYNNYASWLSIISIVVTLNLESTLISAKYDFKDKFDNYILTMLSLSSVSTLFWALIFNLFSDLIISFTGISRLYINVMLTYLLFLPAIHMFQTRERFLFEYKFSVISSLLLAVSTSFMSVIFVLTFSNKLDGRIFGAALPTIVMGIFFLVYFLLKGKHISIKYWKYAIPICLPYIPHLLAGVLLNTMDRVMINKICGPEDTAVYSLAYTCGALVTLLLTSINSAYAPWLGDKLASNEINEIRNVSKKYIMCFLIFAIGIMLISPEILLVLGGKGYLEAKYVINPVAMGCVCQFLYTMFGNVEQFKKKTIGMAFATVAAALVNYVLNAIFIPIYGYNAAAYTTLIGYFVLLMIHMFLVWKIGYSRIYSYRFVICSVLSSFLVSLGIVYSYEHLGIRIILIAIYVFVLLALIYRKKNIIIRMIQKKGE